MLHSIILFIGKICHSLLYFDIKIGIRFSCEVGLCGTRVTEPSVVSCPFDPLNGRSLLDLGNVRCLWMFFFFIFFFFFFFLCQRHSFLKALSHECRVSLRMRTECHNPLISVSSPVDPLNGRSSLGNVRCLWMSVFFFFLSLSTSFVS